MAFTEKEINQVVYVLSHLQYLNDEEHEEYMNICKVKQTIQYQYNIALLSLNKTRIEELKNQYKNLYDRQMELLNNAIKRGIVYERNH